MMQTNDIIAKLNQSFQVAPSQVKESNGKGYRISLKPRCLKSDLDVKYYRVQLCGIDPLTGRDVEKDGVSCRFEFTQNTEKTNVLTYHGTFQLRSTAYFHDGSTVTFREQEIVLTYPQNAPYVKYQVSGKGEFRIVEIESNCWANSADKIWLSFDGHMQRINLQPRHDRILRFYVPTSGTVEVKVQDETIQVRNGR